MISCYTSYRQKERYIQIDIHAYINLYTHTFAGNPQKMHIVSIQLRRNGSVTMVSTIYLVIHHIDSKKDISRQIYMPTYISLNILCGESTEDAHCVNPVAQEGFSHEGVECIYYKCYLDIDVYRSRYIHTSLYIPLRGSRRRCSSCAGRVPSRWCRIYIYYIEYIDRFIQNTYIYIYIYNIYIYTYLCGGLGLTPP